MCFARDLRALAACEVACCCGKASILFTNKTIGSGTMGEVYDFCLLVGLFIY